MSTSIGVLKNTRSIPLPWNVSTPACAGSKHPLVRSEFHPEPQHKPVYRFRIKPFMPPGISELGAESFLRIQLNADRNLLQQGRVIPVLQLAVLCQFIRQHGSFKKPRSHLQSHVEKYPVGVLRTGRFVQDLVGLDADAGTIVPTES